VALPRHRTLRALIDWSHDLLDDEERTLLRRLTVFAGGWPLDAAEAVCAGEGLASDEILYVLSRLVAKCLVLTRVTGDETRYSFLESIREYAAEKLRGADEEVALRARHRDWFLAFAEQAEPELRKPHHRPLMDQLERDRENLRAALGWCIERGEAEVGLRLGGALARFWEVRGPHREVRGTLAALLTLPAAQERSAPMLAARGKALHAAGLQAMRQGDWIAGEALFQEALAISRQLGDRRGLAIATYMVGYATRFRGDYPEARRLYEESLQLFEALDDTYWRAETYRALGVTAYFQGELVEARTRYEASLALFSELGDEPGVVAALNELGELALLLGNLEASRSFESACLETACRIGDTERTAMALAVLAGVAAAQDRPRRALRLAASSMALNEATDQRNSPAWHALVERWLEPARRSLSAEACATELAAGRAMSVDAAVEQALAWHDAIDDEPRTPDPAYERAASASDRVRDVERLGGTRAADGPKLRTAQRSRATHVTGLVTHRELEVAALIARGLTNRQIAGELVIAEGTVANHVKSILARLGLDTRLQIAAWTIERGLHLHVPA
jgi:non-specific serine/threonine protein kinase